MLTEAAKQEASIAYMDAFADNVPMTNILFDRMGTLFVEPKVGNDNIREWVRMPQRLGWD